MKTYTLTVIEFAIAAVLFVVLGGLLSQVCFPREVQVAGEPANTLIIDGQYIPLGEGVEVELDITEYETSGGMAQTYAASADAVSPALAAWNNNSWTNKFSFTAPTLTLNGATASGAGVAYKASVSMNSGHIVIIGVGALLFVAGVVSFLWWSKRNGIVLMLGGVVLAAVGYMFNTYPILTFIVPAIAIAGLVYYWFQQRKAAGKDTALQYIVAGVRESGDAGQLVKDRIATIVRPQDVRKVDAAVAEAKAAAK